MAWMTWPMKPNPLLWRTTTARNAQNAAPMLCKKLMVVRAVYPAATSEPAADSNILN